MLKNPIYFFKNLNFFKSGFYFDFFIKKITEIFIKNFLINGSFFFAEKFIIEFLTKKSVDNLMFFLNKIYLNSFNFNQLFYLFIFNFFYFLIFFEFFLIFNL